MKCGRGHDHASVAEVRACYGQPASAQAQPARAANGYRTNKFAGDCFRCQGRVAPGQGYIFRSPGVGSQRLGQGEWLVSHLDGQCATPEEIADLAAIRTMQPRQAARTSGKFNTIPQGYYATRKEHGIDFWFVRVPDDGKWQGYRFVRRIVGGSGSPIHISQPEQLAALRAILDAGVEAAGNLFADELEECKHCRKPLTRKASREMRKGSTCAENRGQGDEWKRLDALYDHQ